jgi:hypothetical protein
MVQLRLSPTLKHSARRAVREQAIRPILCGMSIMPKRISPGASWTHDAVEKNRVMFGETILNI